MIVESYGTSLDMEFECINDGLLTIFLRGPLIRDKNNVIFPVYIDYISLNLDGVNLIKNNKLVCYNSNEPFYYNVKDGQIIKIHIEWLPFNPLSIYSKKD